MKASHVLVMCLCLSLCGCLFVRAVSFIADVMSIASYIESRPDNRFDRLTPPRITISHISVNRDSYISDVKILDNRGILLLKINYEKPVKKTLKLDTSKFGIPNILVQDSDGRYNVLQASFDSSGNYILELPEYYGNTMRVYMWYEEFGLREYHYEIL